MPPIYFTVAPNYETSPSFRLANTEESLQLCFHVEGVKLGDVITECELVHLECEVKKKHHHHGKPVCRPVNGGFAEVTFEKEFKIRVKVNDEDEWKWSNKIQLEKTVTLCVPADPSDPEKCDPRMEFQCETTGTCDSCFVPQDGVVCCTVHLCECFQSLAEVKLKMLSYGFCLPRACELPPPPPPCPPPPPPQCFPVDP